MTTATLFDNAIAGLGLKNDTALSRCLGIDPPAISKMRAGKIGVSATAMVRLSEATRWTTKHMKAVIAEGGA
ncbi:hypothetical protein [Herbaspirillum huttiense]|uniref:hypothetical protein n=1 Tax=Herbaspirillum huttiense TaxID=863372 RepID=UPI0005854E79|nr:hypothetical protein [Herbaspirillum huttiense]